MESVDPQVHSLQQSTELGDPVLCLHTCAFPGISSILEKATFRMKSNFILGDPLQTLGGRGQENDQTIAKDPGCGAKTVWVSKYGSGEANKNQDKGKERKERAHCLSYETPPFSLPSPHESLQNAQFMWQLCVNIH